MTSNLEVPHAAKPRTVFCRIEDREYRRLVELSNRREASLSELLRSALRELLDSKRENVDPITVCVLSLKDEIGKLIDEVDLIKADIRALLMKSTTEAQ